MRLEKIQTKLTSLKIPFQYIEEDNLGSLDFDYRGVAYHVWEYEENGSFGAESNVRNGGWQEEFTGDYEEQINEILKKFI